MEDIKDPGNALNSLEEQEQVLLFEVTGSVDEKTRDNNIKTHEVASPQEKATLDKEFPK